MYFEMNVFWMNVFWMNVFWMNVFWMNVFWMNVFWKEQKHAGLCLQVLTLAGEKAKLIVYLYQPYFIWIVQRD